MDSKWSGLEELIRVDERSSGWTTDFEARKSETVDTDKFVQCLLVLSGKRGNVLAVPKLELHGRLLDLWNKEPGST